MHNFSILSLSLSSLCSFSPLFVGQNNNFQHFNFKNLILYTVFLNPNDLEISKSTFKHAIGSFLLSENPKKLLACSKKEEKEKNFTSSNLPDVPSTCLYIISDCFFLNIQGSDSNHYMQVGSKVTLFMMRCTFQDCVFKKCALALSSSATTISHICGASIHSNGNAENSLFIQYNGGEMGSFVKFMYSTIFGKNEQINPKAVFNIEQKASIKFQCMNFSKFVLDKGLDDAEIIKMTAPSCLTMIFNTISYLTAGRIVHINPQDGNERYLHLIGTTNFVHNVYSHNLFNFDMNDKTQLCISNCVLYDSCTVDYVKKSGNALLCFEYCKFSRSMNSMDSTTLKENDDSNANPATLTLAHYLVENVCQVPNITSDVGCRNDTCPSLGCADDNFIIPEDVYYEYVFDKTSPPTKPFSNSDFFTSSNIFSYTNYFTNSEDFTKSKHFSSSFIFSKSDQFTLTSYFTYSISFSKSSKFSESEDFTKSSLFSNSKKFSSSSLFTKSDAFSGTNDFSKTTDFTKSTMFSESEDFTKSSLFSNSKKFSSSFQFTKSNAFSETNDFSKTTDFTKSTMFSESEDFTKSSLFSNSKKFSSSFQFTKSNAFSGTNDFSKTTDFTKSTMFSESEDFTKSSLFSDSKKFSSSFLFTKSNAFSGTNDFSKTTDFTRSTMFSESEDFTKSALFSNSKKFSQSTFFSDSKEFSNSFYFSKSKDFTKTTGFTETAGFTKTTEFSFSLHFSKSENFSPSDNWNKTHTFSPTINFTSSNQFSNSISFTHSKDFSKSNEFSRTLYFTETTGFTESGDFSRSTFFSDSKKFSSSFYFTKSDYFSNTKEFSKTSHFTKTAYFSESNDFSHSKFFSDSNHFNPSSFFTSSDGFTKTDEFSQSTFFTNSELFSKSSDFSESNIFTKTGYFDQPSKSFSSSFEFSGSFEFSPTQTLSEKSNVVIIVKQEDRQKNTTGIKIGVGVAVGGLALAAIIVGLILLRRRKLVPVEDIDEEEIDHFEDKLGSVVTQNPLMTLMEDDDPFDDEFY